MINENVKELTDANFDEHVLQSEVLTLVVFWAEWSGPSKQIAPIVRDVAADYKTQLKVGAVDVEKWAALGKKFGVRGLPQSTFIKGGKAVGTVVGGMPRSKLDAELNKHL